MSKKLVERERFDSFMRCLGWSDLPLPGDSESPDFLLRFGDHTIGVEVTQMVSPRVPGGTNPRQTNHILDILTSEVLDQYLKQGGAPIHATLCFERHFKCSKRHVRDIAQQLATAIVIGIERAAIEERNHQPLEVLLGHPLVSSLAVWPCRPRERPRWHPRRGGMVDNATAEDVFATLQPKEEKLEVYRRKAAEVWLLIICDLMVDGLFIDPPEDPVPFALTSGFDRIFCLAWTGTYAVEVPVLRPRPQIAQTRSDPRSRAWRNNAPDTQSHWASHVAAGAFGATFQMAHHCSPHSRAYGTRLTVTHTRVTVIVRRVFDGRDVEREVTLVAPIPVAFQRAYTEIGGEVDWQPGATPAQLTPLRYSFVRQSTNPPLYVEDPSHLERSMAGRFLCTDCYRATWLFYVDLGGSSTIAGAHRLCEECYVARQAADQ